MPTSQDGLRIDAEVICRDLIDGRATDVEWEHFTKLIEPTRRRNRCRGLDWPAVGAGSGTGRL